MEPLVTSKTPVGVKKFSGRNQAHIKTLLSQVSNASRTPLQERTRSVQTIMTTDSVLKKTQNRKSYNLMLGFNAKHDRDRYEKKLSGIRSSYQSIPGHIKIDTRLGGEAHPRL